jgi:hypothetical protein
MTLVGGGTTVPHFAGPTDYSMRGRGRQHHAHGKQLGAAAATLLALYLRHVRPVAVAKPAQSEGRHSRQSMRQLA